MKFSHRLVSQSVFAALLLSSTNALASDTSFTYSGIYKSLKTAGQTEFSQLSLNFYLKEIGRDEICPTSRVYLSDGENSHDLSVTSDGKLLLPLDKKLKKDHAAITLVTDNDVKCHLAMELAVADFELEDVSNTNMLSWLSQFDAMFAKLAGWPGKYFMPGVVGLKFELEQQPASALTLNGQVIEVSTLANGKNYLTLSRDLINELGPDEINALVTKIKKVTPVLEK